MNLMYIPIKHYSTKLLMELGEVFKNFFVYWLLEAYYLLVFKNLHESHISA